MPMMQAIMIAEPGGAAVLQPVSRPIPVPQPGEVLIKAVSAGVNRADILQRQGKYPPPPGASPDIPGLEVAGKVIACDPACIRFRPGDRVMALLQGGGYATHVAAPESVCMPVPDHIALRDAGALPEALFTVWANLFVAGQLRPGETVLIQGGSSGIGSMAVQMVLAHGAVPLVTAGNADKRDWCRAHGAALAIDYSAEDFVAAVQDFTQGRGVDVILDVVGGSYLPRHLSILAAQGRLVTIATQQGWSGELDLRAIMHRRAVITGSTLRARPVAEKARLAREIERRVLPWMACGAVKSLISHYFPINLVAEAHKTMESGMHRGKIALDITAS
ncbi:MAG: NAD(P)H-quinone oxidoreductase [Alphaproteobacteria bacterium]